MRKIFPALPAPIPCVYSNRNRLTRHAMNSYFLQMLFSAHSAHSCISQSFLDRADWRPFAKRSYYLFDIPKKQNTKIFIDTRRDIRNKPHPIKTRLLSIRFYLYIGS